MTGGIAQRAGTDALAARAMRLRAVFDDLQAVAAGDALPRYIRDKVAQTTAERAALRAAQAAATP